MVEGEKALVVVRSPFFLRPLTRNLDCTRHRLAMDYFVPLPGTKPTFSGSTLLLVRLCPH